MKKNILESERGKEAQAALGAMMEVLAPYMPTPDVRPREKRSLWSVGRGSAIKGRPISAQQNATACLR